MSRHAITLLVLALIPSSISELIFNFTDFPPNVPEIEFFDDAHVEINSTSPPYKIGITTNQTSPKNNTFNIGRFVYNKPIPLHSSNGSVWDFTTRFKFVIDGLGNPKPGDGMAFFLVPVNWSAPMNSTGCWLGLFNASTDGLSSNQVVAVEFDTFQNAHDPSSPESPHMGIDVNRVYTNVTVGWEWDNAKKLIGEASVVYNHTEGTLSATLVYQNGSRRCNISQRIDLTTVLPENVWVGFSATTGYYTEHHFLLSWDFLSTLSTGNRTERDNNSRGKWVIPLVAVCSTVLLVLLVLVTILAIKRWKKIKKEEKEVDDSFNIK